MKKTTSFQLDASLLDRLDELVGQDGGNRSALLRRLITALTEDPALLTEVLERKEVVA
jgi:metal-responsive CopG/Arc/MetJ family transcriptional regulator